MNSEQTVTGKLKRKSLQLLFFMVALALLSFAVLFLWNSILPKVTPVSAINYWQAMGLLALCRILFSSFRLDEIWERQQKDGPPRFLKDKLITMNEAERAAFKKEWRRRCERRGSI